MSETIPSAAKTVAENRRPVNRKRKYRNAHRWGKIGDQRKKSLDERFWEKVDKNGPVPSHVPEIGNCWVWMAMINGIGRPFFSIAGTRILAYRMSWELEFGKIPKGHGVLHKCDNPSCVRPDHLFTGTALDNVRDMIRKGRSPKRMGELSGKAKITEAQAIEIKSLIKSGMSHRKISKLYPIGRGGVYCIQRGETWTHV